MNAWTDERMKTLPVLGLYVALVEKLVNGPFVVLQTNNLVIFINKNAVNLFI